MTDLGGRRVFIVTDDARRGESQYFLLHLMRHLRAGGASVDLFTWSGGGLLDEYHEVARVRDLEDLNRWLLARLCERLGLRRVGQVLKNVRLRRWLRPTARADAGYLSGPAAARICGFLPDDAPPLVCHLPGSRAFPDDLPDADRTRILERVACFVVSSDELAEELTGQWDVAAERVVRQDHELLIDLDSLSSDAPPTREDLGIPPDATVVAGAGTADWWAAPDPFVVLAWEVRQRLHDEDVDPWFVWIGPDGGEKELWPLHHDLLNAGLTSCTRVLDAPTSVDALNLADVFVLATRDDLHVRLTIEAAARGLPVVRTEGVGEALGDTPTMVPYLDGTALTDAVSDLVRDPELRDRLGRQARTAVGEDEDTGSGLEDVASVIVESMRS